MLSLLIFIGEAVRDAFDPQEDVRVRGVVDASGTRRAMNKIVRRHYPGVSNCRTSCARGLEPARHGHVRSRAEAASAHGAAP